MPHYVDGYVLPVPKKNLPAYRRLAVKMAKIFREHGALAVWECVGDGLETKFGARFTSRIKLKSGEALVFSWVTYQSRAHRDRVNTRVMNDPRCANNAVRNIPFDIKRMLNGGFKVIVSR